MHPRKPMLALCCALLSAAAVSAHAVDTRYVYLVNDTKNRILSFSLVQQGGEQWTQVPLGRHGLRPGAAEMIAITRNAGDHCLYDAKIVWRDGSAFVHKNLDFCTYITYHPGRYLHAPDAVRAESVAQR
ncbi:MAG TPA: hypothetical protein VJ806_10395 [Luteimonas sp.]|nr:hypothetical protein [Luteimonas sp.]